ncbi:MAG: hypothetical protein WAV23_03035 [Minisyncoccia bacterium]
MSYIMVSGDFPDINSEQRKKIYECLKLKNWKKVTEPGRDIDTVWYGSFVESVSEVDAKRITKSDFETCSSPYCMPKLVVHWGPEKPSFYNLV